MTVVVGVDGGQTGTRAAVFDRDGNLLSHASTGASWQGGTQTQLAAGYAEVRQALSAAVSPLGEHRRQIQAVGMGMTAVQGLGEQVAAVYRAIATEETGADNVAVVDDRL